MQGTGLIKSFLFLITLVCVFQLFYYIPTRGVESKAEAYAETSAASFEGKEKVMAYKMARARYLDSMSSENVLSIPLLANYTYSDLKRQQLALGLDLKGGMSILLEVDLKGFLVSLAGRNAKDPDFVAAIEAAEKAKESNQSEYISLFVNEFRRVAPSKKLAKIFQQSQVLGEINQETSDGEVERMLRAKADETVGLTFKLLKERIDRLGVVQPNISLDAARDLILVEMPGIDNPQRARQYLQASAQLEFWETFRISDNGIMTAFMEADSRLKALDGNTTNTTNDTTATSLNESDLLVADSTAKTKDSTDVAAATSSTNGPLLSLLTLNNSGQLPMTVVGLADKNKKAAITAMLERPEIKALFPKNVKFLWSYKPHQDFTTKEVTNQYQLYAIKTQLNSDKAPLEGDAVTDASPSQDPVTGEPKVSMIMDAKGAKKWAELTGKAFDGDAQGNRREIAIVLDDEVITAPSVNNGAITGGSSEISGAFNVQETVDLANILEVGKLPAKTKIIQESSVGPSLGQQNITKSLYSLVIGFLLVMVFMVVYYAGGGLVSIITLLANLFFIFGALSSFGTVLTLPGIAGVVLTIGMAVDANVIIFERIREELRSGKSLLDAISDGFKFSYSAIIDANVTTILTAIVLAYFGLGPIKGFAVVLIIGVISSLISSVVLGKLIIDYYTKDKNKDLKFSTGASEKVFSGMQIDWMGRRKVAYAISGVMLVASLASILISGFDYGVDFKGGHSYVVNFAPDVKVTSEDLRATLSDGFEGAPVVKQVDARNSFNIITSYKVNDTSEEVYDMVTDKLYEGIAKINPNLDKDAFKNNTSDDAVTHISSYSKVGSSIADDIKSSSLYAGSFALILIFLYIFIRFSKWQFSLGAVAALFHDTIIVLGLFSMLKNIVPFSLEVDQAFIAAILTVIGYSINDTVIVFDRIREFVNTYTNKPKDEVYNLAINTTLSRTMITSFTTLFVVFILFLFGGSSITGFAFAILMGILIGTYSSIFIATPIMRDLSKDN